jgi:hypothetical protein
LRQFEHLITSQTKMVTLLRNPHYELAERLLVLNRLSEAKGDFFGARDSIVYEDAIDFAANLDFKNEKVLRRSLRSIPEKVAELLSNPLVRCLTAQNQEETLYAGSIPAALDTLASFAVVGLRSHSELFIDSLGTLLGITADDLPRIGEYKMISELGEMLCRIGAATDLIDRDLELYGHVIDAFSKWR